MICGQCGSHTTEGTTRYTRDCLHCVPDDGSSNPRQTSFPWGGVVSYDPIPSQNPLVKEIADAVVAALRPLLPPAAEIHGLYVRDTEGGSGDETLLAKLPLAQALEKANNLHLHGNPRFRYTVKPLRDTEGA